jgi:hypothetical protein
MLPLTIFRIPAPVCGLMTVSQPVRPPHLTGFTGCGVARNSLFPVLIPVSGEFSETTESCRSLARDGYPRFESCEVSGDEKNIYLGFPLSCDLSKPS